MVFLVWSLVLFFFKCGGRRKFGCASGSLPETPTRPASMGPADPASGIDSSGGKRSAGGDSHDGAQLPQCVQTWLEAEQQREKDEMEEAESEINSQIRRNRIPCRRFVLYSQCRQCISRGPGGPSQGKRGSVSQIYRFDASIQSTSSANTNDISSRWLRHTRGNGTVLCQGPHESPKKFGQHAVNARVRR